MADTKRYKILVYSWNTQSISLGETLNQEESEINRSGYVVPLIGTTLTTWQYQCDMPDFYPKFASLVTEINPDIVVIGFQEDRRPGSYFHSHLLPTEMPKIGYSLVKRTRLMGIGATTFKGLKSGDFFERGIRMSIYCKSNLLASIEREEINMRATMGNDGHAEYICSSIFTRGKGAVCSYLILPGCGRLAFVCCHLPFNSKSLLSQRLYNNKMLRQNELNHSNVCFNNIIENLVLYNDPIPDHVIFFGDFNYRVNDLRPANVISQEFINADAASEPQRSELFHNIYRTSDEMLDQMSRENIYKFMEGINDNGPLFLPTCKMSTDRLPNINHALWRIGKSYQRNPSWCDRIIYQDYQTYRRLQCTMYDRFDFGTCMTKSDHAAVIATFEL